MHTDRIQTGYLDPEPINRAFTEFMEALEARDQAQANYDLIYDNLPTISSGGAKTIEGHNLYVEQATKHNAVLAVVGKPLSIAKDNLYTKRAALINALPNHRTLLSYKGETYELLRYHDGSGLSDFRNISDPLRKIDS